MFSSLLVVFLMLNAVACGISSDWREVRDNLKDAHFSVLTASTDELIEDSLDSFYLDTIVDADDVECMLSAYSADDEIIIIVFCKDKDSAKDIYDFVDENYKDIEEELELDELEDVEYDINGKVVYLGTKSAIKAAKG